MLSKKTVAFLTVVVLIVSQAGCHSKNGNDIFASSDTQSDFLPSVNSNAKNDGSNADSLNEHAAGKPSAAEEDLVISENYVVTEDYRTSFAHGDKTAQYQKYIMLHDTEVWASPVDIINSWDNTGTGVAAHFIVGADGRIFQCVPLDKIAHHAGFGDSGHNEKYGVVDESRDDRVGTSSLGSAYPDYGMNSFSIGIELVHVGGQGEYPNEQLLALDWLIAWIDTCYGFECDIIDHKMWRTTNPDTSLEFEGYLLCYQQYRSHKSSESPYQGLTPFDMNDYSLLAPISHSNHCFKKQKSRLVNRTPQGKKSAFLESAYD